ncbi:MAG: DUF4876 domain-containing protein [Muribaculaceae bacterium]|nr:DUF4876 domain-containing protein [Muribaculaceae bacterium]
MRKFLYILPIVAMFLGFASCSSDDEVIRHTLTVNVQLPSELQTKASETQPASLYVTAFNTSTSQSSVAPVNGNSAALELIPGTYNITVSGELESYNINGVKTGVDVFSNKSVTIDLIATVPSTLVFKEVYFSGVNAYYFQDAFYEIYNNTDEVQYLDGVIMGIVDFGFAPSSSDKSLNSVWMADGKYIDGKYPLTSHVQCFPGSGQEYPIQPRTSIVVAANPMNHTARVLAEGDDPSPVDLTNADWQLYVDLTGFITDTKFEGVPNMTNIWKTWGREMMPATDGQPIILAKLPAGVDPVAYAADASSVAPVPGGTNNCFMIPVDCVLDAIDIVNADPADHVKRIEAKDDAGMTWVSGANGGSGSYTGKSLRRKVAGFTIDGKAILKDTNNSTNDFVTGGSTPTPGVIPTTVD